MQRKLALLFLIVALGLSAQTTPGKVTVTGSTSASIYFGTTLYCAARWINPTVQLYCYTSSPNKTWDTLLENRIFTPANYPPGIQTEFAWPGSSQFSVVWFFHWDPINKGVVWDLGWNDWTGTLSHEQMGIFQ